MPRAFRRLLRFVLLVVVPAAAIIVGAQLYVSGLRYVTTENAYIKAHTVTISPEVSGRLIDVLVAENQTVHAGQVLLRIAPETFRMELARADAEALRVANDIEARRAAYRQAQRELAEAEEKIRYQERVFERAQTLAGRGVFSQARLDEAEHELASARQVAAALQEKLGQIRASLGGDISLPVARNAAFLEAKAKRDMAALDLARTTVAAPVSGTVAKVALDPGEFVEKGTPALAIVRTDAPWIEANVKETDLAAIAVGQPATVVVDAYPDARFRATVASISPSTGAEFAVIPPQNATGNWVKVVQRVPVRLALIAEGPRPGLRLRAGMTAKVRIDTGREHSVGDVVGRALAWTRRGE